MTSKHWKRGIRTALLLAAACLAVAALRANAQSGSGARKAKPAIKGQQGAEVTLTGRVVDLQHFMAGMVEASDPAHLTAEFIKAGVPAGLETPAGLIILGEGKAGAAKTFVPLAFKTAEVRGRLFEKAGIRYLDVVSATPAKNHAGEKEEEEEEEDEAPDEDD